VSARATLTAPELAELLGVSCWAVYEAVRSGEPPVPAIRVGRRIVFARSAVEELLGLSEQSDS